MTAPPDRAGPQHQWERAPRRDSEPSHGVEGTPRLRPSETTLLRAATP